MKTNIINTNTIEAPSGLLSIIPLSRSNTPYFPWEHYKQTIAPISIWRSHLIYSGNVGVIAGTVSGNLQVISLNALNDLENFILDYYLDQIPITLKNRLLVIVTPADEYQIVFRGSELVTTSEVLARHADQRVLIQALGEGEYFCFNRNYHVLQGRFDLNTFDIQIPELTQEECDFLLQVGKNCQKYYEKIIL